MSGDRIRLKPGDVWVSCSAAEIGPVGHNRHIILKGGITTVCGASASSPEVWRQNKAKPRCEMCVELYKPETKTSPVKSKRKTAPHESKQTKVVPLTISAADLHRITEELDNLLYSASDLGKIIGFEIRITVSSGVYITAKFVELTQEWELEFQ